jgi:phytoene synthase
MSAQAMPFAATPNQARSLESQQRDLNACVDLMRGGSKTFFAASRLLPARMRTASIALYAFCRVADDLVDNCAAEGRSVQQSLNQLRERLDAIYAGHPQAWVEDRALAAVVQQYQLPRELLDALLEGFSWDASARTYETLEDVQAYAARVAGSVGAMMCWLMGVRSADALARACELGVAMQLTNIARDVGEDARNARLYLPRQWLREAGVDIELWLTDPICTPALKNVIERLLCEADRLYLQSTQGIASLPRDCRSAIMAARLIYAEIGEQLRRDGLNPVQHRAVVATSRKLSLLASAWLQSSWLAPVAANLSAEPLAAIDYLVRHCTAAAESLQELAAINASQLPQGRMSVPALASRPLGQRAEWMLELFERQEISRRQPRQVRAAEFAQRAGNTT